VPGRPPKPTKLKLLQGNPGKRKLPKGEPEPELLGGDVPAPEWLTCKHARAVWVELAPMLAGMGVFTVADTRALGQLCRVLGTADMLDAAGAPVSTTLAAEARMYFARFGMTPADRARVSKVDHKPESKLERYVGGKA
jgi:hypothetical protein